MLLAVDVGNTHTVVGVFDGDQLVDDWRLRTAASATEDEVAATFGQILALQQRDIVAIDSIAVSSVVPALSRAYAEFARRYVGCEALIIGPGMRTGVKIRTDNPHEVGADRIVNVAAAYERYGRACIVIDMGTATSYDAVTDDGTFIGGAIAPGLGISFDALVSRAAQLASVELVVPDRAIGTNTVTNVQSGTLIGTIAQLEGMISRFRDELGSPDAPAIATGGYAERLEGHVAGLDAVDPQLTLRGLHLVASRQ